MPQKQFKINKCIYCGGKGETDEHIIPFALGGTSILIKASCEKCRDITSRCERNPLKEIYAEARAVLDYPSRRRDFGNETFPLKVTLNDGTDATLNLTKKETFGFAPFLEYLPPAFFGNKEYKSGIIIYAHSIITFGEDYKILAKKYGIKTLNYTVTHKGNNFERMVAKIAYCSAIALWGLDNIDEKFVLPAIIENKDDIGYWVGCDPEGGIVPLIGKINSKNVIRIFTWEKKDDDKKYIIVRIKFFGQSDAPEYIIVVGTLKPSFIPESQSDSHS